jgi:colicin import membrane protein
MSVMVLRNSSRNEPGLFLAGVLALLVHVVFAVFMFFGLNWKSLPPEGLVVDLWQDWSQPVQPVVKQPPVKKEPVPSEPAQQPKPTQQSVQEKSPPPEIASSPPPKKPDIVRKEKSEKPEPVTAKEPPQEMQRKQELEKREERELEKQRKKEEAEIAEAQRLQREEALQRQREQEVLAAQREAQQAAERARIMDEIAKYRTMILAKVRSRIVMPPDLPGNPMTEFDVTLLPGGDILNVQLRRSSGYASFDSAVERAVFLSEPLPLPSNPALFKEFRNLNVTVHYHE